MTTIERSTSDEPTVTVKLLGIDAWRDSNGWIWNNFWKLREYQPNEIPQTARKLLRWLRSEGYLSEHSKGRVMIDWGGSYAGLFIEIQNKNTGKPLLALSEIH